MLRGPQPDLPAGPDGRPLQSHSGRQPRLSPLRRHPLQPHGLRGRHHRPAAPLCAGRAGASLRGRRQGEEVRALGVSGHGPRRFRGLPGNRRGGHALHEHQGLHRRGHHVSHRRAGTPVRPIHQLDDQHRLCRHLRLPGGGEVRQRRDDPDPPHGHSGGGQAAAHVRVGPGRRGARLGASPEGGQPAAQADSRVGALVLPGGEIPALWQSGAAGRGQPGDLRCLRQPGDGPRRQDDGLSRRVPHRPDHAEPQAGRHPGDLRKVHGRGSARGAHEDFPGGALLHGRALGGL